MAGTERYLYFATALSLVRVNLSPLLNHIKPKQRVALDSESISFRKNKLPFGTIPLYRDNKLYLIGPDRTDGAAGNTAAAVVVEVALDVSWGIDDPIRRQNVNSPVPLLPFLGSSEGIPMVAEFDDKIFFFHKKETDESGNMYGGEVLDLKTGSKSFIKSLPPFGLADAIAIQYTWGPYYSVSCYSNNTRYTFDMRTQKWLEPWKIHIPGDLTFLEAATAAKCPIPFFFTHHGVAHLGENLYITFIDDYDPEEDCNPMHLILYQFSSDDLTQICKHRVLFELDTLFYKLSTPSHQLVHLGGGVVCMASIVGPDNLHVAAFKVNGIGKKAKLVGRSIRLPSAIPKPTYSLDPRFFFTIDDHPIVAPGPVKHA